MRYTRKVISAKYGAWLSLWVSFGMAACSDDDPGGSGNKTVCDPGAQRDCEDDGRSGTETCDSDGTAWGSCITNSEPDGSAGAGASPGAGGSTGSGGSGGGPRGDAGPDASPPPACDLAVLPEAPTAAEEGDTESFVVAVKELSYGNETSTVGFSITSRCTPPGEDPWQAEADCDATNGVGALLAESEADPAVVDEFLASGKGTLLIRVRDYNGRASDDQITVDLLSSAAFDALEEGATPAWDGDDAWPIRSDSVDPSAERPILAPLYSDATAYITNGQLAARLDSARIWLPFASGNLDRPALEFELQSVTLTCTVTGDYPLWQLDDCILGGRWPEASFLGSFAQFRDPLDPDAFLCQDAQSYKVTREFYCGFATVGDADTCDAIAFGAKLHTAPALISNLFEVGVPTTPCSIENDPASDSCYTVD